MDGHDIIKDVFIKLVVEVRSLPQIELCRNVT